MGEEIELSIVTFRKLTLHKKKIANKSLSYVTLLMNMNPTFMSWALEFLHVMTLRASLLLDDELDTPCLDVH